MSLLASVIEKYPYFQSARALQLKGLKNDNSFLYNDALKLTAAHTTDRDILFEYITSERFIQNEISQIILQHDASVNEIEVVAENISEMISIELDKQIKAELSKAQAILNPDLFERKLSSISELAASKKIVSEEIPEVIKTSEAEEVPAEKTLKINEPLEFRKEDTHSFSEWLKLTRTNPINRNEEAGQKEENASIEARTAKDRKFELIEKFIQKNPKLEPKKVPKDSTTQSPQNKNLAALYSQTPEALMTETLAKVYLQQKNYTKAVQAYKILILKYPEKSGFFADQIRAIKKLTNTEEQ
jgi:hypothetical protein